LAIAAIAFDVSTTTSATVNGFMALASAARQETTSFSPHPSYKTRRFER
jgi:hypothetical protein